jgi:hypothetical protein
MASHIAQSTKLPLFSLLKPAEITQPTKTEGTNSTKHNLISTRTAYEPACFSFALPGWTHAPPFVEEARKERRRRRGPKLDRRGNATKKKRVAFLLLPFLLPLLAFLSPSVAPPCFLARVSEREGAATLLLCMCSAPTHL